MISFTQMISTISLIVYYYYHLNIILNDLEDNFSISLIHSWNCICMHYTEEAPCTATTYYLKRH